MYAVAILHHAGLTCVAVAVFARAAAPAPAPAAMRPRVPSVPSEYLIPLEGGAQLDVGLQAFVDALDTKQSKWRPGRVVKHFPNPYVCE